MANEVERRKGPLPEHDWISFRLGRMCWACNVVQANGEFDDIIVCRPRLEVTTVPQRLTTASAA